MIQRIKNMQTFVGDNGSRVLALKRWGIDALDWCAQWPDPYFYSGNHRVVSFFPHNSRNQGLLCASVGEGSSGQFIWPGNSSNETESNPSYYFVRSIRSMQICLDRDIYRIADPEILTTQIKLPASDPLIATRYSWINWLQYFFNKEYLANLTDSQS